MNSEVLKTNLFIGSVIIRNSEWGNKFVDNLSKEEIKNSKRYCIVEFEII